jgi:hypothetical protein
MQTIHKYELPIRDEVQLQIPEGSTFLHLGVQHEVRGLKLEVVHMWFLVDPAAPVTPCTYLVRGTGHKCDGVGEHLGTVLMRDGALVWHVFAKRQS